AADNEQIEKLASPYRVIRELAEGSPALSINVYGADLYTDESLAALEPIAEQVVSLNMDGMPIGEKGLEMIAKFHNLRDINLNDTPVDDQGLAGLTKLEKLRAASLSGTAVTATGLKVLLENPGLQKIYVWNTAMTQEEATQLMAAFPAKAIGFGFIDC